MALKSFICPWGAIIVVLLCFVVRLQRIKRFATFKWQYCTCNVILAGVWIVLILYLYKKNVRTFFRSCSCVCVNSLISYENKNDSLFNGHHICTLRFTRFKIVNWKKYYVLILSWSRAGVLGSIIMSFYFCRFVYHLAYHMSLSLWCTHTCNICTGTHFFSVD